MAKDDSPTGSNPGVGGAETPEQAPMQRNAQSTIQQKPSGQASAKSDDSGLSDVMPDDSDSDGDGRTGVLSTRTEVHAIVVGVAAGAHWALTGDMQLINDVAGLGIAGDRTRRAKKIPEKYQDQAKKELPYFLAGVAIGYAGARSDVFAGTAAFGV